MCKIWTSLIHLEAFFSLTLIFALFPKTNVMQLSKQSLVRWRRFFMDTTDVQFSHQKRRFILKILKIHTDNSYQSELLFIQDNVYNDYRTVFYHLLHQWIKIWKSGYKLRQSHKLVRLPYFIHIENCANVVKKTRVAMLMHRNTVWLRLICDSFWL